MFSDDDPFQMVAFMLYDLGDPSGKFLRVFLKGLIMIVLGAAFIGVLKLLWPETDLTAAVIVMFLLPPPFVLPVFADDADQRAYVSSVLSICTLVSILGFALLAVIG